MRWLVIGTSGSGKTTFARALATRGHVPCIELDALFWTANWTPRDPEAFRALVDDATAAGAWVADGNYGIVRDLLWPKATDVVWLNFGRATVYRRVLWRTVVRAATRQPLWAGNRESLRRAFLSRHSILLWAHTTFRTHRAPYPVLRDDPRHAHLRWHELRSPAEARRFLGDKPSAA